MRAVIIIFLLNCIAGYSQKFPHAPIYPTADSLLKLLNSYRSDEILTVHPDDFSPEHNVNDKVKQTLLCLLKNEWDADLLEEKFEAYKLTHPYSDYFEWHFWNGGLHDSIARLSSRIGGRFDSVYHAFYERKFFDYKEAYFVLLRSIPVRDEIILSAARAGVREAIPFLKEILASGNKGYAAPIVEVALAIFGDPFYLEKFYRKHAELVEMKTWEVFLINADVYYLRIIKTQESYFRISDWMDTAKMYRAFTENDDPDAPLIYHSADVVPTVLFAIRNHDLRDSIVKLPWRNLVPFPQRSFYHRLDISKEQIQFIKEWMIRNRGRYILN